MKLFVCTDERGGMLFNKRRTSSDINVLRDMLRELGFVDELGDVLPDDASENGRPLPESRLYITPFSEKLFEAWPHLVTVVEELSKVPESATAFLEDQAPSRYQEAIDELVVYRWMRVYPYDLAFDLDLSAFQLEEKKKIAGHSHDMIVKERYVKR